MDRLPHELVAITCRFLPVPDLVALSKTAHRYRDIAHLVMLSDDATRTDLAAYIVSANDLQFLIPIAARHGLASQFRYLVHTVGSSLAWPYPIVATRDMLRLGEDTLGAFAAAINGQFALAMRLAIIDAAVKDDAATWIRSRSI